jgi:hypothetical protein
LGKNLKEHANFFKHANEQGEQTIEFNAEMPEVFIMYAIIGIGACGERHNLEEQGFLYWIHVHRPELLTEQGRKNFTDRLPVEVLQQVRSIGKNEFLHYLDLGLRAAGRR